MKLSLFHHFELSYTSFGKNVLDDLLQMIASGMSGKPANALQHAERE